MRQSLTIDFVQFNAAEIEAYRNLKRLLQSPTDTVEVLKALIFVGENVSTELVSSCMHLLGIAYIT